MELEKKKKPTVALLAVVFSVVVFGGITISQKINSPTKQLDQNTSLPVTTTVIPPVSKNVFIDSSNTLINNFPSPFSEMPTNINIPANTSNDVFLQGRVPQIPNAMIPNGMSPIGIFHPPIPGSEINSPTVIRVKAIFYGSDLSQNMAIVAVDSNEITVREGSRSNLGFIASITKDSVTINDNIYFMERAFKSKSVNPINIATPY